MEHFLLKISVMLVPGLLAITLHEVAHGWVAERCGDPTARLLGRLTLNPFRHLDPFGVLLLLLIGFGWARPVPVTVKNLRRPQRDMMWVALGGPAANLALALLSALALRGFAALPAGLIENGWWARLGEPLVLMAAFSLYINVILTVINLVPVPPLDGGRVLTGLLPRSAATALASIEPFGMLVVIFLFFFSPLWERVLLPAIALLTTLLAGGQWPLMEKVFTLIFKA
jgi:Zn-dependent protease